MSWINSRRVNTLTPHSLARHPVLWVQAVSSFSLYFSYKNSHIFLAFFSSAFLWSLLQLLFPYLLLLLPIPCLFLLLESFPSPFTQLMALTRPQPAASGSMSAQMDNCSFQSSSLGCSLGEALPCTTSRVRDTDFAAQSRTKQLTHMREDIVLTKRSTAGSFLLISSLEEFRESGKCL